MFINLMVKVLLEGINVERVSNSSPPPSPPPLPYLVLFIHQQSKSCNLSWSKSSLRKGSKQNATHGPLLLPPLLCSAQFALELLLWYIVFGLFLDRYIPTDIIVRK